MSMYGNPYEPEIFKDTIVIVKGSKGVECYYAAKGVSLREEFPDVYDLVTNHPTIYQESKFNLSGEVTEYGTELHLDEDTMKKISHYNLRTRCKGLRKKIDRLNKQIKYLERNRESLERQYNSQIDDYEKFSKFMETMREDYHEDYMKYVELEMIKSGHGDLVTILNRSESQIPVDEVKRPKVTDYELETMKSCELISKGIADGIGAPEVFKDGQCEGYAGDTDEPHEKCKDCPKYYLRECDE